MLREDFTYKLGRIEYSMTKYQKLIRVLIPFEYEDNKLEYTTVVERWLKKQHPIRFTWLKCMVEKDVKRMVVF